MDAIGPITRHEFDVPEEWNVVTGDVIGCAMEVHTALGPGLTERLYEDALSHELGLRGLAFARQVPVRLRYKGIELPEQRLDLVVENLVVVELKSVEAVGDIHLAQLTSYLRSASLPLGLLINFNTARLKDGIYRRIHSVARASSPPGAAPPPLQPQRPSAPSASAAYSPRAT